MAELDSFVTGVGEYPAAPDTSVQAFLDAHPVYTSGTPAAVKWWKDIAGLVNAGIPPNKLHTATYNDWLDFQRVYNQWSTQKTNEYNALIKTWEAAQNSPLNQSQLLEAAGYNRNWLQGAANSGVQAAPPMVPSVSQPGGEALQGENLIQGSFQILDQLAGMYMSFMNQRADIADKAASVNLKDAQAQQIRALIPFKMSGPWWQSLEKAKAHGFISPGSQLAVLPFTNEYGLTVASGDQGNFFDNMMALRQEGTRLAVNFSKLNNEQKRFVVKEMIPWQRELKAYEDKVEELNLKLLEDKVTESAYRTELIKFEQEFLHNNRGLLEKTKKSQLSSSMVLPWVNATLDILKTGGSIYMGMKGAGLGQQALDQRTTMDTWSRGMDWLDHTGEILPSIQGMAY